MKKIDAFYRAHPSLFVVVFVLAACVIGVAAQFLLDRTFVGVGFVVIILAAWFLLKDWLKKANNR